MLGNMGSTIHFLCERPWLCYEAGVKRELASSQDSQLQVVSTTSNHSPDDRKLNYGS